MTLPITIDPCPIREATVEIRFESTVPPDAIFGIVYNKLSESYSDPQPTAVLQIPEFVRVNDPNLQHQPHYKIKNGDFLLQLGPKTVSLGVVGTYPGWNPYLAEILSVFGQVRGLNIVSEVTRLGLRYINTFEIDIFEKLNLELRINENTLNNSETYLRTTFEGERYRTLLQVANNALIQTDDGVQIKGSLIDIDVSRQDGDMNFFENIESLLNEAHQIEKAKFFELLKKDFLETLNPRYEDNHHGTADN